MAEGVEDEERRPSADGRDPSAAERRQHLDARLAVTVLPRGRRRLPRRRAAGLAGLVAGGVLASVIQAGSDQVIQPVLASADVVDRPAGTTPLPRPPVPDAERPEGEPALPVESPVTLAFAGDVHAEGGAGAAVREGLPSVREVLGRADVAVVNLETAVTERGTRVSKQYAYRAPASVLESLKSAGVDVVTLANNHGLDYGRTGLVDTLAASTAAGLPVVGIGLDEDRAYAPHVLEVRGQRIAVLGATQVLDRSLQDGWTARPANPGLASAKRMARLLEEVARAREVADTVVVYLHWGRELEPCPLPRQQDLARELVAAGADVVVGSHAHVLLGGGWLGTSYVDYGLGNFAFGARSPETVRTGILTLSVTGRAVTEAEWTPGQVRGGAPTLLRGEQAGAAVADKARRRDCTGLAAAPQP